MAASRTAEDGLEEAGASMVGCTEEAGSSQGPVLADMKMNKCRKCELPACVILRAKDLYCKDCFISATVHKFRGSLGKTRLRGGRILVAHSGGTNSSIVLRLLYDWMQACAKGGPQPAMHILHIDECTVLPDVTAEECASNLLALAQNLPSLHAQDFPTYLTSLDQALMAEFSLIEWDVSSSTLPILPTNTDLIKPLKEAFDGLSLSKRESLLGSLRTRLILNACTRLDCPVAILGTTGSETCVQILSELAQGRLCHVPIQTLPSSKWPGGIQTIRPLRDLTQREVTLLARFLDVAAVKRRNLRTGLSCESVQSLTETFLTSLQKEFPSTEYAILGTASKLQPQESDVACPLCQCPMPPKDGDLGLCYGCRQTAAELPNKELQSSLLARPSGVDTLLPLIQDCLLDPTS